MAWYLPGGRKDNTYRMPIAFANVRGSVQSSGVCDTFLNTSSANVVFTENAEDDFVKFLNEKKKLLGTTLLVVLYKKEDTKTPKRCEKLIKKFKDQIIAKPADDANFDEVYEELKSSLENLLNKKNKTLSLTNFAQEASAHYNIETDDKQCYYGQKAAERILKDIDEINKDKEGSAKSILLPCQSDLEAREEIASLEKELCRQRKQKEDTTLQSYTEDVKNKIWSIQLQQLQNPISDTYKYFLQCIVSLGTEDRKYFLQCLKMGLDERSVQYLKPLYEKYAKCRFQEESSKREQQLQEIDEKINHGSFGLEHFFREIAVMFDNIVALERQCYPNNLADIKNVLTAAMADLFIGGTALEIMDGDSVTVPVNWLRGVLEKVRVKTGTINAKIFKVYVLGAQSCGKSTLLNTIFGLNFPVSSGRCTRGAYMQLVKVE